jgi:uncharacterized protein YndB with AHSA1/START domain
VKAVAVSVDVPQPREAVYDFLDVMANHEPFTNHMLKNWRYSGPDRGVGAKAKVDVAALGRTEAVEMEVIDAERPLRIVERNVAAGGRVGTGTYVLDDLPGGGTRIRFEYRFLQVRPTERLMLPLARAVLRRGNRRALERLAEALAARQA